MNSKQTLKTAFDILRGHNNGLTPEAVICLLFCLAHSGITVGVLANATGFSEPTAYRYVSELQKAGFLTLHNMGTGANELHLSDAALALKAEIDEACAG